MSAKFEESKLTGMHSQLAKLVGEWEGTATTWFEPDKIADQSPVKGSIRSILGGRFVLHEYTGSWGGKPLEGLAIFGYHLELKKWQSAWIDSFHNGAAIMFSESGRNEDKLKVLGSYAYVTPQMEQHWGWRTEIDVLNDDEIRLTAYNISPEGEESKATETMYKRVK
jgi:hypothetical protein